MRKALFFLIDSLRWDTLNDPAARKLLFPNLARLAERGHVLPATSNAQSTQFVMPALFSLTYPLDHGGYNNGIRDRPKSYVELLREAGFETHLMASGNQLGITMGYDRGFDTVRTTSDYRTLLQQRIDRTLMYEVDLWRKGIRSEAEVLAFLKEEFANLLRTLAEAIAKHDKTLWTPALLRGNRRIAEGCGKELELLSRSPRIVLDKLLRIASGVYWRFLGQAHPGALPLFLTRALSSLSWRTRGFIAGRGWIPFLTLSHRQILTGDVMPAICRFVEAAKDRRWYLHLHAMDVHDCRAINRPLHVIGRFRFFPRWLYARLRGLTKRRFLYDSAIMYVDQKVGDLLAALERSGQTADTAWLVTGDHGLQYGESPRAKENVGLRMHYEDIDIPLLIAGMRRAPSRQGLIDMMGIAATLVEEFDVPLHESHKGVSAFRPGREAVISESCGHGNADLARRDIYFCVTTVDHRMMAILEGTRLTANKLYDRRSDPRELRNLAGLPEWQAVTDRMMEHLRRERGEILALRVAA